MTSAQLREIILSKLRACNTVFKAKMLEHLAKEAVKEIETVLKKEEV